jgi:glutathione S-transferase
MSLSTLTAHNIHLIPIQLTPTGLSSISGLESRPSGTSLPIMRIQHPNNTEFLVHESSAILEYLQEIFPGENDINGSTIQQRARSRDILSLLSEAMVWSGVDIFHSDPRTTAFSGLSIEGQSASAAAHGKMKFHKLLEKLEGWVRADVEGKGTMSLAGGDGVTFADLALMAPVEYFSEVYGREWIEGHGVLGQWYERMKKEEWVVGREKLGEVEESGVWEVVLGK